MNKIEQFLNEKFGEVELSEKLKEVFTGIDEDTLKELFVTNEYYKSEEMRYVYFLKNLDTGLTKIGSTGNLSTRIKTIISNIKNNIGVEHSFALTSLVPAHPNQLDLVEKHLHCEYKDYRKFGEWFDLNDTDDMINYVDEFTYIDNTLIVLDNSFDVYPIYNLSYDITNDELRDFFNVPTSSLWHRNENKYLDTYKTCRDNKVGFCTKKKTWNKKEVETLVSVFTLHKDSKLYTISELKKEKLNRGEIQDINKWLKAMV